MIVMFIKYQNYGTIRMFVLVFTYKQESVLLKLRIGLWRKKLKYAYTVVKKLKVAIKCKHYG